MPSSEVDLLTAGRVNLDLYAQQVGVGFAEVAGFDAMVGGSPANIAVAAARLGVRAGVFTAVGDDIVGDWVLHSLEREHVGTAFVARKGTCRTSLALLGQIPPDRFPRIFYRDDPADIHLTVDEARRLPLDHARAVLISGDVFARGSTAQACTWILHTARGQDVTIYVDLDLRPENWPALDAYAAAVAPMAEDADVVLGTAEEFAALVQLAPDDQAEILAAADARLASRPGRLVVLKCGADGATLLAGGGRVHVPAYPVPVASTVGAGDAFAAGLIAARLRGRQWADAARFATACSAITVSRLGCSRGFPTSAETLSFLDDRVAPCEEAAGAQ
jgi:5-dehydro-2-deoxygluconokinase